MKNLVNNLLEKVQINIYEVCNLSCQFCPISKGFGSEKHKMNIDTFKEIISQLNGYTGTVSLTSRGESLLHPQFKEFVETLHHKNRTYKTLINHNSTLIDNFKDDLLMFDFVRLNVYNSKFFSTASTFKKEFNNSKHLINLISRIDLLQQKDFNNRGGILNYKSNFIYTKCFLPYKRLFIDWNGNYLLCCNDWKGNIIFENINKCNIFDFYLYNKEYSLYKKKLLLGLRKEFEQCKNCNAIGFS